MSTYDSEQLDRHAPAYLANYGLSQAPFSNQHDDHFLYLDTERAQRLNMLQHMIQYNNLLLIVQGDEGVGKTSLLTRFIKSRAENWFICLVEANTFMDAGQLLFKVAQGFGVQQLPQDSVQLQEMLYAQIATYHHNGQIPILIIDDAHELPKDALLAIFNLADAQVDNANLLRIILFAEPQIEKSLNARDVRPLRERVTHTMSIPLLDEDTTAEYLKHRMAVAGFNGGSPFTPKMVKRIFRASCGNPARINQLAHETLDRGDLEPEEMESIVKPVRQRRQIKKGALVAIAVIVVALVLVLQNMITRIFVDKPGKTTTLPLPIAEQTPDIHPQENTTSSATATPSAPGTASSAPGVTTPVPSATTQAKIQEKIIPLDASQSSSSQQAAVSSPTAKSKSASNPPVTNVAEQIQPPVASQVPAQTTVEQKNQPATTLTRPRLTSVEPSPVPSGDKPQNIIVHGEGFTANSRVFVRWTDKDHEIPPTRVKLISDKQLQVRLTVGREHDKWQLLVLNPDNARSNILDFKVETAGFHRDQERSWVLSQSPEKFTLQLFGSHELENAKAFIRQHQIGGQAKYFVSEHKGKIWYSVIYGVYPDRDAAQSAMKTLPASLKAIKPWVRRFDDIQASINVARQPTGAVQPKERQSMKPVPDQNVITAALPTHGNVEQNESWIWSQDPSNFTLQLLGVRELASVKKFLKNYADLSSHAVYFHTRHDGRDWYAIIYGVYTDRQKARAAITRLPPALQKVSPWIRTFASIHAELSRTE